MIDVVGKKCCGCTACKNVCMQECIIMKENEEGFLYPSIDYDKCIGCGLCETVCPVLNKKSDVKTGYEGLHRSFAVTALNEEYLERSSSGGVFSVLAERTLAEGGLVFGASFSDDFMKVEHIAIDKVEDLGKLQGSKYLQSDLRDAFIQCKGFLEKGSKVLFSGVPCQIAGLKRFLGKEYESLICVEMICHGTPSSAVWQKYLDSVGAKHELIQNVFFRDKTMGWENFSVRIDLESGKVLKESHRINSYMGVFLRNYALRESCYVCLAKGDNTCADITLGDFWGVQNAYPEYYKENGVSVVITHTGKGLALLEECSKYLLIHETDLQKSLEENWVIYRSVSRPEERDTFFGDLKNKTWRRVVKEYLDHRDNMERIYDYVRALKNKVKARLG